MSGRTYTYHPNVLRELERWGIAPAPETEPSRAYFLLKAIYCFEIREMKQRRREKEEVLGPQPLEDYRRELDRMKERYDLLRVPARKWVEEGS